MVLCHAHQTTPSSPPPESRGAGAGPPRPSSGRAAGRVRTPWEAGLCSSHHVLPVGGRVRPLPRGSNTGAPSQPEPDLGPSGNRPPRASAGRVRLSLAVLLRGARRGGQAAAAAVGPAASGGGRAFCGPRGGPVPAGRRAPGCGRGPAGSVVSAMRSARPARGQAARRVHDGRTGSPGGRGWRTPRQH